MTLKERILNFFSTAQPVELPDDVTLAQSEVLLDLLDGPMPFDDLAADHDDRSIRVCREHGFLINRLKNGRGIVTITAAGVDYLEGLEGGAQ